ncbi:MAG: hypothetical protein ACRDTD_17675, partial [Pseudonocardiaceae bacterium]
PDVFGVAALVLRVVLADGMIEDLHRLARRNALARERTGSKLVEILFAGPSPAQRGDLAALANEAFHGRYAGWRAASNPSLWLLARLIGGAPADHGTLLSFLFFDPAFTAAAATLGHTHARSLSLGVPAVALIATKAPPSSPPGSTTTPHPTGVRFAQGSLATVSRTAESSSASTL